MAATDGAIVQLTVADAPAALLLSDEAHWNQTEDDWRFFLQAGTVFGMRDANDALIATAAVLPYDAGNAWISMVLVTASRQRRGIATKLLDACLDASAKQKLTAWLDASPAGAAVYGPLGFTPAMQLHRLRFAGSTSSLQASPTTPIWRTASIDDLLAHDRIAMGFDRSVLLTELAGRAGSQILAHDGALALIRNGRTARHLGPVFAGHSASAIALIETVVQCQAGPILIDVVGDKRKLIDSLIASDWINQRSFQRMRFGRIRTRGAEPPFAGAGPEYG